MIGAMMGKHANVAIFVPIWMPKPVQLLRPTGKFPGAVSAPTAPEGEGGL